MRGLSYRQIAFGGLFGVLVGCTGSTSHSAGILATTDGGLADGNGGAANGGFEGGALDASAAGGATTAVAGGASGGTDSGPASCLDQSGNWVSDFNTCTADADCGSILFPRCCGSDGLTGIRRDANCTMPPLTCAPLGCAKSKNPETDNGVLVMPGDVIKSVCIFGRCETVFVESASPVCGTTRCKANELCVYPPTSVGGPAPQCVPALDGGACPPGTHPAFCVNGSGDCIETYVPPPPHCATIPAACGYTIDCSCIPQDLCGGGADFCQSVEGHAVTCVNRAP